MAIAQAAPRHHGDGRFDEHTRLILARLVTVSTLNELAEAIEKPIGETAAAVERMKAEQLLVVSHAPYKPPVYGLSMSGLLRSAGAL